MTVLLQVVAYLLQVRFGSGSPADPHLGAQHLFKAGVHFVFFDEFTPVGLRISSAGNTHTSPECRAKRDPRGKARVQALAYGISGTP
jgi:hypothetical protein